MNATFDLGISVYDCQQLVYTDIGHLLSLHETLLIYCFALLFIAGGLFLYYWKVCK